MPKNFFQLAIASAHIVLLGTVCFAQGVTVTITPEAGNPQGAPNPRWLFTVEFQNGAVTNGSTEGPYFVDHFQIFTSNVGAIDPTNDSCMFEYTNRNTEPRFHIFADTPYIQQAFGPWTDWSSGISENSQCRVWAQDATRTTPQQGPNLIVRFYVEGTSLMEGDYGVRIAYGNWYSNWSSGWGNFANYAIWTPRSTLPNPPTKTVSVVSQGSQSANFDVSMSSSGGAGNGVRAITRALLIVNTTNLADGQDACYAIYHRTSRELLLIDSSGNVGLGARLLGTSPAASSTFSSSNCTVDMGQAWFSETFSTHRIVVPTVFSNSFVNRPGVKNVFFLPIDRPGNSDSNANYPANTWPPALTYNISGMVGVGTTGVPGIPVNLTGTQTRTITTDASGNYSFSSVPNGNYTVNPELSGYTFLPPGQTFTNVASNVTGNFSIATVEFPILPGGTPPGPIDATPVPTPPADVTASATFCNDISGIWNAEGARSYSLFQAGSGVTGTATQLDPVCGNVTWDINGSTIGTGLFTLTASNPSPPVDSCGNESGSGSVNLQILSCSIATQSIVEPPLVGPTGMRRALAPATTTWTRNSTPRMGQLRQHGMTLA